MRYIIIACEVMRPELEQLSTQTGTPPKIRYLKQGLHDTPKALQAEVQDAIDKAESDFPELTHIILGYGLCGQGLAGVLSSKCELVIPRVHDCVPLFMGSRTTHKIESEKNCGTYWFSPGWLTYSVFPYLDGRVDRLNRYVEKYGEKQAKMLMEMEDGMLSNYTRACLITWPGMDESWMAKAEEAAERSNLPLTTLKGNPYYLKALLQGPWDDRRFLRIPPGRPIAQSMDAEAVMKVG